MKVSAPEEFFGGCFNRKESMKLQIRDSRDPFTQGLAILLRTAKDATRLKRELKAKMAPLVVQVAVKIGGVDTERSVRDRALPVFTGIISLYLAKLVYGKDCNAPEEWAKVIANNDLVTLFRQGYTMLDELVKNQRIGKRGGGYKECETVSDRLILYATHRVDHVWAGFQLYRRDALDYSEEQSLQDLSKWLAGKEVTRRMMQENQLKEEIDTPEMIVRRALLNFLHSGKVSIVLNFKKVRGIVDSAQANKKWLERAQMRFTAFIERLPDDLRPVNREDGLIEDVLESTLRYVVDIATRKYSRAEAVDGLCLFAGLNPPGLTKEARDVFS